MSKNLTIILIQSFLQVLIFLPICQAEPSEQIQRLSHFLQFETTQSSPAFSKSFIFLQNQFPKTFDVLEVKKFGNSFLLKWQGSQPQQFLFSSHQDIVPANPDDWSIPPFDGVIKKGKIFGRGAIDNKSVMLAILESIEKLLNTKFKPQNTLYFAFGADEESGGLKGAKQIANFLKVQGVDFDAVFDEGGGLVANPLPFSSKQFALIGITERTIWQMNLKLNLGQKGHSALQQNSKIFEGLSQLAKIQLPYHFEVVETLLQQIGLPQVLAPLVRYHHLMKPVLTSSIAIKSFAMHHSQAQISLQIRGYPCTSPKHIQAMIAQHLQNSLQLSNNQILLHSNFEIFQQTPNFTKQLQIVRKQGLLAKFQQVIQNTFHQKHNSDPLDQPCCNRFTILY